MTTAPNLRRLPQQDRSRRRVEHVLETADELLGSEGPDALTTTRLAEAAGISVGSLYQWFPDKEAIAHALAVRYADEFREVAADLARVAARTPFEDPAGTLLDAFARAFRARPGFRAMWFGGLRTEALRDATRPALTQIGESVAEILAAGAPHSSPKVIASTARMAVLVADALLREAFRNTPHGDRALLADGRVLLRGYLGAQLHPARR